MMEEIITRRQKIERELEIALSTMEKKDIIQSLRKELLEIQNQCPHVDSQLNYTIIDDKCPYCGKKIF